MSSSEALERLKNWLSAATPLVVSSISRGSTFLRDTRVLVFSVDDSFLVLSKIDPPMESESIELAGVQFSDGDTMLQLRFPDGKSLLLRQEE